MKPAETKQRRANWKQKLLQRLHDPLQLRIFIIGIVLAVGYFGIYTPLSERIAETKKRLDQERKLETLAANIERLEKQSSVFTKRLVPADAKEWVQYVHEGVRQYPLKLSKLDSLATKTIGPYKAMALHVEVQGSFFDLDQFLRWLESNQRLMRTDDISIGPPKSLKGNKPDDLVMKLTVLGMAE
jgi:type II secretory pathway component PulM